MENYREKFEKHIKNSKFEKLDKKKRALSFAKLWAKDEDMKIIAKEYSVLCNEDESYCIKMAINYSKKNKDFKNLKKRLKGKKVNIQNLNVMKIEMKTFYSVESLADLV